MLVLVEDATETITSSYVEAGYLVGIGDLRGLRLQRADVRDALVRSVSVVELFELVEGIQQVPLVPNQGPVQEFAAAGLHPVGTLLPNSGTRRGGYVTVVVAGGEDCVVG
jgi:hypothetical protein